jgi:hypothetical protein
MARCLPFVLASDSRRDLERMRTVAGAVEAQIAQHVGPLWRVEGVVRAYRDIDVGLREMPKACPVLVSDKFAFPAHGVHLDYEDRQPFVLIRDDGDPDGVSTGISHEIIEVLIDPHGDRTVAGPSIKPGQGPVEYLVEACDPPERQSYRLHGVCVSDFCTPRYYDASAPPGSRFDHMGVVESPLDVLPGGYLSWRDAKSGKWWQLRRFDEDEGFADLGVMDDAGAGMRAVIDHEIRLAEPRPRAVPSARASSSKRARIEWMAEHMQPDERYPPGP